MRSSWRPSLVHMRNCQKDGSKKKRRWDDGKKEVIEGWWGIVKLEMRKTLITEL